MEKPKILVFGNPMVRIDSTPLRIIDRLRECFPGIEFVEFDPNDNLEKEGSKLVIIDTVAGIKDVKLITEKSIDRIRTQKLYSMHDYDLGYNLKLLKKLGYVKKVRIIGIPIGINDKEAVKQVKGVIASLF